MAFAFFRRRQKTVIITMVVLMVSFVVGPQVISKFGQRGGKNSERGRLRDGTKIRASDVNQAERDIRIFQKARIQPGTLEAIFAYNGNNALTAYVLLVKEAERFGPVSKAEVDNFLAGGEIVDARYRQVVSDLRSDLVTEKQFRQAVARLIQIGRAFAESQISTPPSQAEIEQFCFAVTDQIRIRFARFPAEQFVDDVEISPEQMAEQVASQFDLLRGRTPGTFDEDNPFGFGYGVPDRAAVEYLLVRMDLLMRVVRPTEHELRGYFASREDQYTKQVPTGEVDEDGEPIMRTEQMSYGEAKGTVIEQLRPAELRDRLDGISRSVAALVGEFDGRFADEQELTAYEYAVSQMQLPAEGLLDVVLADVRIKDELLTDAVELLAELAGLQGICYPLTDAAGRPLEEDARVTVIAEDITLGEALGRIASQLGQPELTWVQCQALTDRPVLFAAGPLSTFPLLPGKTDLVDQAALAQHSLLGKAANWIGGQPQNWLVELAFHPSLFNADALAAEPLAERQYQNLQVPGEPGGVLMWRVSAADPAHDAEELTPEISEAVAADVRTAKALRLAREHAERMMARARASSLGKVAEDNEFELVSVDQFGRAHFRRFGVEGLVLSTAIAEDLEKSLFGLTAEDGADGPALAVLEIPSDRSVCLVQLMEHIPAVREEFEASRPNWIAALMYYRNTRLIPEWFRADAIVDRVGYEPSGP